MLHQAHWLFEKIITNINQGGINAFVVDKGEKECPKSETGGD